MPGTGNQRGPQQLDRAQVLRTFLILRSAVFDHASPAAGILQAAPGRAVTTPQHRGVRMLQGSPSYVGGPTIRVSHYAPVLSLRLVYHAGSEDCADRSANCLLASWRRSSCRSSHRVVPVIPYMYLSRFRGRSARYALFTKHKKMAVFTPYFPKNSEKIF